MNTQLTHTKFELPAIRQKPVNSRKVMIILATLMALQMTSYVLILPLFAQILSEFGAGADVLAASSMAFAIMAAIAAPLMGGLADRFGRKPLILIALSAYLLAFAGYMFVGSPAAFVILRGAAGAFTAGFVPAVTGIVADLAPQENRAKWIGIVSGGTSIGWIIGPSLGGFLFDHWGFETALMVSIAMALVALITVKLMVPETRKSKLTLHKSSHLQKMDSADRDSSLRFRDFMRTISRSFPLFGILMVICFLVVYAWAFIEPSFMFYVYDDLGWSPSMLGMVMSVFGIAMTVGEFTLGQLSDHLGRKPVVMLGLVLFSAQFLGLALSRDYVLISISFIAAGLGNALLDPVLIASALDITPEGHQAKFLGIKSSISSLGNIVGPAMSVFVLPVLCTKSIFLCAVAVLTFTFLIALCLRNDSKKSVTIQGSRLSDSEAI